jgi:hypothetical protein
MSFFILGYLLEPRKEIWHVFLNFGRIMAIEDLKKHLMAKQTMAKLPFRLPFFSSTGFILLLSFQRAAAACFLLAKFRQKAKLNIIISKMKCVWRFSIARSERKNRKIIAIFLYLIFSV